MLIFFVYLCKKVANTHTIMKEYIKYILLTYLLSASLLSYSQSCVITSKANDILPDNLCAPVHVDWEITYRGVDDGGGTDGVNPWTIEIEINWDDGNTETVTATLTDASTHEWKVNVSHDYPVGGNKCNYKPTAQLVVDGVTCTSSIQEQNVTVWDTDNYNGGHLEITPQVFPICVGSDGSVTFTDNSLWNCVPPVENDNPNSPKRWTQWVYGTNYTYNNIEVDGTVESYPFSGAVVATSQPIYSPEPPNNTSLPVYAPPTGQVGDYWEITLNNWNYCNPYDQGFPPISTTAIIIVVDTPDATINPAGPFCANDASSHLSAATSGGTWSGPGVNSSGLFNPANAGPGTHIIHYTVTSSDGCTGTDTLAITVYAVPTPNIIPGNTAEVCPGDILHLDGNPTQGDGNIISHQWTGDTSPLSATNIQDPFFQTNSQGVYNLTYTVTDDNGCTDSEQISVAVNPVVANILPDPALTCAGTDFILNGNPSGGTGNYTTHIWTGDVTYLNRTDTQEVIFNSPTPGTYNLTYTVTDDNGCTDSDDISITVFENPVADAGPDDSICGNTITVHANASIGTGNWQQVSGPGNSSFSDANSSTCTITVDQYGLYSYSWTETYGANCTDSDTLFIRFTEQPVADAGLDSGICGYSINLNANPSVGNGYWSLYNGPGTAVFDDSGSASTQVTVNSYGNYYFKWKEDNGYGCADSAYVLMSFNFVPIPEFAPADTNGCSPFVVNFINQSQGTNLSYNWDFDNGFTSTETNPVQTFYNHGNTDTVYTITLAVNTQGCGDTISHQLTVHPLPQASFTTDAQPDCSPMTANFQNTSNGSNSQIWNFGDGTQYDTSANTSHTFVNDTNFIIHYNVSIIAINEYQCTDTASQLVTVYPNPHNNFEVTPDSSCSPATIDFIAAPSGQNYSWDFGNGIAIQGSNHEQSVYVNDTNTDTTYNIRLITTTYFGCVDTSYGNVTIHPSPTADFNTNHNFICAPGEISFINNSENAIHYIWDFGDGDSLLTDSISVVSHIFDNPGSSPVSFTVTLTAINENGCTNQKSKTINVYPQVHAYYLSDTAGCSPLNIAFQNQSGGATQYKWEFGDNIISTENSPEHLYENTSGYNETYQAKLIAISQFGCRDTFIRNITVYPTPEANFTATPSSVDLPNAYVSIANYPPVGNWNYYWNFGDGQTDTIEQPGYHTYDDYGTFTISLVVSNTNCSDTAFAYIQVNAPAPVAQFTVTGDGCEPLVVYFNNQSLYAESYVWDFGDGNHSTTENPTYTYYDPGEYQVTLTVTGPGGTDIYTGNTITVYPKAKAFFNVAPSVVTIPDQAIHCYDMSENANIWTWNFGDGESSSEQNPEHFYKEEGTYTISLTANNEYNCPDTYTADRAVTAENAGIVSVPNAFTPSTSGDTDGKYDPTDFSNDVFHPVLSGVEDEGYVFRIFNRWGELIFETKDKTIGWTGYYRGKLCKQDVYVWTIEGRYINGVSFVKKGDVTLLR